MGGRVFVAAVVFALLAPTLPLFAPPGARAQASETTSVVSDPEGDATVYNAGIVIDTYCGASCNQAIPPESRAVGVPAPPTLDIVDLRMGETPEEFLVEVVLAELDPTFPDATEGEQPVTVIHRVCWGPPDGLGCYEILRFGVSRSEGNVVMESSFQSTDGSCNTRGVCRWGVDVDVEPGAPGLLRWHLPRGLAPRAFDEGTPIRFPNAQIALRTLPTGTPHDVPVAGRGTETFTIADETAQGPDFVLSVEAAPLDVGPAPAFGNGPGVSLGTGTLQESDVLRTLVIETPDTLTFATELGTVAATPSDHEIVVQFAFQGGLYHQARLSATQGKRSLETFACAATEASRCDTRTDVPGGFTTFVGSPGWVNLTYARDDIGSPGRDDHSSYVSAGGVSYSTTGGAEPTRSVAQVDSGTFAPAFRLRLDTGEAILADGALSWPDPLGDAPPDAPDLSGVEARAEDGGAILLLDFAGELAPPPGADALVVAAALERDGRTVAVALVRDATGDTVLCGPDALVLAAVPSDPRGTMPSMGVATVEGGRVALRAPAECLTPAGDVRGERLAAGVYALQGSAPSARVVPLDSLVAPQAFVLAGTAAAPVDTRFSLLPWILGGIVAIVVASGVGALVASRRRAAPVAAGLVPKLPAPGETFLGKYLVEREIARGSFGVVWAARHLALDRAVVLKQLHLAWSRDSETLDRFRREARILAELDHPNVTRIHDVEELGGAAFIVMEFVDGGSAADLRPVPLPLERVVDVAAQALEGLAHVHERGVVHHDLKPANLLVTRSGVVKLADFGVARPEAPTDATVAVGGAGASVLGTPGFMAPERLRGERGDARSDLYAIGVLVHELATGRSPFHGPDPAAARLAAFADAPSIDEARLGPSLAAWVRRAVAADPEDRFPSARTMREALLTAATAGVRP